MKLLRFALVLAILFSFAGITSASAQGGLSFSSSYQVVNLSSTTANITITFYNTDGTTAGNISDTISGNSSKTYFMVLAPVPAGFQGSMVIAADQQITAITNLQTADLTFGASTTSFSAGNTTFYLPIIMCNNSSFNTFFSIQNVGASTANVTINYVPGSSGVAGSESTTIPANASKYFDQAVGSTTKNCSTLGSGPSTKFLGSAKVTSDQPVVATVMQLSSTTYHLMMGYNGFPGGATTLKLPLAMGNNNGYYTSIQIQNVGGAATTVTVDYSPNTASGSTFEPVDETCNLAADQACTLFQQNIGQWVGTGKRYIGAATVTATQPLVAIVNQNGPSLGSAYEGFASTAATASINVPLIMANNSNFYTTLQVQNTGGASCASVTVDYSANTAPGGTFNPTDENFSLAANASKTIFQAGLSPSNGSVNNWGTGNVANKYIGSARILAPGCTLLAIVNQQRAFFTGDTFMTYIGLNY